jgi:hypothetical protein
MMLCLLKEKDNLYLSLPNEMSDSDGIRNKDDLCVKKYKSQRNKGMAHEARRNIQNCCFSIDKEAACHVGIVNMEVINLAEMSEYFARYC